MKRAGTRSRLPICVIATVVLTACAARGPVRPAGASVPDPAAIPLFTAATSHCAGLRTLTAELGLSGRAGGERLRGRVITGLEVGGRVRLEGVAPFGPPVFILAGDARAATLLLPRDHRVLAQADVAAVVERLTGLALGGDDLRLVLSGCLVHAAAPAGARQWPSGWKAVLLSPARTAYLRRRAGRWVVAAADVESWRVDYAGHLNAWPREVRIRTADGTVDLLARVQQLEVNVAIDAAAFTLTAPADATPMTLDELRSVAPLRRPL